MMKNLLSKKWEAKVFKEASECPICLDEFCGRTAKDEIPVSDSKEANEKALANSKFMVTPLPCSKHHVFHTSCIKEWLWKSDICPLCKKQVTGHECKELAKNFTQIYN